MNSIFEADLPTLSNTDQNVGANDQIVHTHALRTMDPGGDVILVVGAAEGKETFRVQVSSKILSLASPVFSNLFSPRFREGLELRNSPGPIELPLEDDPQAMILLSGVLHYRRTELELRPNLELLCTVADLCNKYQCADSISGHSDCWLQGLCENDVVYRTRFEQARSHMAGISTMRHLVFASYFLERPIEFRKTSTRLALAVTVVELQDPEMSALYDRLPGDMKGAYTDLHSDVLAVYI